METWSIAALANLLNAYQLTSASSLSVLFIPTDVDKSLNDFEFNLALAVLSFIFYLKESVSLHIFHP